MDKPTQPPQGPADTSETAGIPTGPIAWFGAGGIVQCFNPDQTPLGAPIAMPAGTLVVFIPHPAGEQIARQMGMLPEPGKIMVVPAGAMPGGSGKAH
jgi:hypothetical protein